MLQAVINAFKIGDLRRKIFFTLAMLVVFRLVAHVPVPGVDFTALRNAFDQSNPLSGLFNVLSIFSGGALQSFSVAAMGVYPYITASIIIQLLTGVIPRLTELSKEGESGRNQINKYTHWLTLPLAALQAFGQAQLLQTQFNALPGFGITTNFFYSMVVILSLVTGTMFLVWIGELITENGVGQGISIIIFGGIVSRIPATVFQLGASSETGAGIFSIGLFVVLGLVTVVGIIMVNEGQRRIPVHYSRSIMRGGRMMRQAGSSFIPLRVNSSGMIPLIFALSIMAFPAIVSGFFLGASSEGVRSVASFFYSFFQPSTAQYNIIYFLMVVLFTFFYTSVVFNQQRIAENLQKSGGAIPGIRPGQNTDRFLNTVLTRITVAGAVFLGLVAIAPWIGAVITGVQLLNFSSTALLIVVGVAIDTMKQLESQLLMRRYEGFINR
ncbi:MAG: preprotein translocase subunit SecY [Chloroflexia bacterium]|jgi:preprotein translocase subunit SecY|nr:preprotein translocase subunit SecY [Chloroflexia bacterium]